VFGLSALVETLNNPRVGNATESSFLGPFFSQDAPDRSSSLHLIRHVARRSSLAPPFLAVSRLQTIVSLGESIASEGKGEYMYVEGRVLTTSGEPIPGAIIDTWETDSSGERHFEMHVPSGLTMDVRVRRVHQAYTIWSMRNVLRQSAVAG
jgi:hypothetical protein